MRLFLPITLAALAGLLLAGDASAQRRRTPQSSATPQPSTASDTPSVVMLPAGPRQKIDTSLIAPIPRSKRRRFEVKVVPATAPGRSRQEVLYSDSLGRGTR